MSLKYISGTFSANGNSSSVAINGKAVAYIGSSGGVTFNSGTVTVQLQSPTGDWCNTQVTATAPNVLAVESALPTEVRLVLSGATGTPDIDYAIQSDRRNVV